MVWMTVSRSVLFVALAVSCIASQFPDVESIIAKSVEANDADWKADPHYDYTEKDRTGAMAVTYRVTMMLGTPYSQRVMENGRPLSPGQKREEQQKYERTLAARRAESPRERASRIAAWKKDRDRDHLMMSQLTKAFNFRIVRQQSLAGHHVWVVKATPRPDYQPPNMETQALKGMEGTLWIDKDTCQWVKVEARVVRPVSIEGFLARVEPGTYFELEKAPVSSGIWLTRHFSMRSSAKVLGMFHHGSAEDETYSGYRLSASSAAK